jgi:hypothetical protein
VATPTDAVSAKAASAARDLIVIVAVPLKPDVLALVDFAA